MEKLITTSFLLLTIAVLSIGASTPLDKVDAHRIISTGVETLSRPIVYVEATHAPILVIPSQLIFLDTVPESSQGRRKIIKTENGRAIEITIEDGQVSNLKIDGQEIPAEEYDQHEKLVKEMVVEFDNIPSPPAPPNIINEFPPAPPSPPGLSDETNSVLIEMEDGTERLVIISNSKTEMNNGKTIEIEMEDGTKRKVIISKEIELEEEVEGQEQFEEHRKQMEIHREKMEEHRQKIEEQREKMIENQAERMEEHQEIMRAKQKEMKERMEEIAESNQIIAENIGRLDNTINTALEDQLLADGLIDSRENYQFELTGKKLKVNRKAQSDAMHQKYKQLYSELSGTPLSDKSKIKLIKSKN